jgi:hypothetical protein
MEIAVCGPTIDRGEASWRPSMLLEGPSSILDPPGSIVDDLSGMDGGVVHDLGHGARRTERSLMLLTDGVRKNLRAEYSAFGGYFDFWPVDGSLFILP